VVSLERTHARRLDPAERDALTLPEHVHLVVVDVSFISVTRLLPGIVAWLEPGGEVVTLVKPQFESQPRDVPKGVVHDPAVRRAAIERVAEAARAMGLEVLGEVESSLVGPAGNREYFLHLRRAAA
jgi:23S rRNA (cytidine1920-2'-O)/16S rRNA (cytidine1409-2'-O)-methyltransferase